MVENNNVEETIELFVKGKLTEPSLSEFQKLMLKDKALASSVKLQSITVAAIKESRKMTLKSRLDSINVGNLQTTGNPSSLAKYFSVKSAAIALATISVGISTYLFTQSQIDNANDSNISANQNLIKDSVTEITDKNQINTGAVLASSEPITSQEDLEKYTASENEVAKESAKIKERKATIPTKKLKAKANGEEMLNQKFEDGTETDIAAEVPQVPATIATEEKALHASDVDIKNVQDGKYSFHYMLKESTLFLYGNFDASPYEILEFNQKDEQSFYLFYDQSFFALKKGQTDPIKLRKISDAKLLQNLVEARNKKH